jgi:hypothetical protein
MPPHKQARPLTEVAVRNLKPGTTLADVGDHRGLRVSKTKIGTTTFFYRYRSPASEGRLRQYQIGRYPAISLAGARAEHSRLKGLRDNGTCPVARRKEEIARQHAEAAARAHQERSEAFTVKRMIDAYLQGHIEDKYGPDGAIVRAGARKPKGQAETRRTLYNDAVRALGELSAESVTPRNICDLITEIVDRGANVQAGNVLRELTAAFDFSIGAGLPASAGNAPWSMANFENSSGGFRPAVFMQTIALFCCSLFTRDAGQAKSARWLGRMSIWNPANGISVSRRQIFPARCN